MTQGDIFLLYYIKVVNPRLTAEVVPGDIVQAGVVISNSETGLGAVCIQPLIFRLVCSNGMVVNEARTRRNHVGRVNSTDDNISLYSQETLAADDRAFVMKIQDTVRAAVDEARFSNGLYCPYAYTIHAILTLKLNRTCLKIMTRLVQKFIKFAGDGRRTAVVPHAEKGEIMHYYVYQFFNEPHPQTDWAPEWFFAEQPTFFPVADTIVAVEKRAEVIRMFGHWLEENRLGTLSQDGFTLMPNARRRYFKNRFGAFQKAAAALQVLAKRSSPAIIT